MSELLMEVAERACTYQLLKWNYRSQPQFNPYVLASLGYACNDFNTIRCVVCHNTVSFCDDQGDEYPVNTLQQQLKNHQHTCIYLHEKPIQFEQSQLYLWVDDLIDKTNNSYITRKQILPMLNLDRFWQQAQNQNKKQLLSIILNRYQIDESQMKISFVLIALGWEYCQPSHLVCRFCGRNVNFAEECQTTNVDKQEYPTQIDEQKLFDPFDSHRYFCFWVHGPNIWNLYIQSLWDRLGESSQIFRRKNPQNIKKIRVLLDKYLETFHKSVGEQFEKVNQVMSQCQSLAKILENQDQSDSLEQIKNKLKQRRAHMKEYMDQVNNEIKLPLKKMKI